MPLLQLPNEILLIVAGNLGPKDLNSFLQTNRHLTCLLTPLLHELAVLDKEDTPALPWAVQRGYVPLVKLLLEKGKDVEYKDTGGRFPIGSALHWAAHYGHVAVVKQLLDMGVDPSLKDTTGDSAFPWAIRAGRNAVAALLVEMGVDVNEKALWDGGTALHWAAKYGDVELIKLLLMNGADINCPDGYGKPPLFWASEYCNIDGGMTLVNMGADLTVKDSSGLMPGYIKRIYRWGLIGKPPEMAARINPLGNSYGQTSRS